MAEPLLYSEIDRIVISCHLFSVTLELFSDVLTLVWCRINHSLLNLRQINHQRCQLFRSSNCDKFGYYCCFTKYTGLQLHR